MSRLGSSLKGHACASCKNPDFCLTLGRWCDVSEETKELARRVVEAQKNDKRTEEEKIADGVRFIMDTRLGGD